MLYEHSYFMRLYRMAAVLIALFLAGCSKPPATEPDDNTIDSCIGNWRLTSFCGTPADIDIYIAIRKDSTFTLYQRNHDYTPARFSGNYIFDAESHRLSGRYDDGTAWADSYIVEDADGETMIWANAADKSEISVYTRSEIPASMLGGAGRTNSAGISDEGGRFL